LLNTTAIVSGYAGCDPQGGTAIEALSKFFLSYQLKSFFLVLKEKKRSKVRRIKGDDRRRYCVGVLVKTKLKEQK